MQTSAIEQQVDSSRVLSLPDETSLHRLLIVGIFIAVVGTWEVGVRIFDVPHYILPTPSAIVLSFRGEMRELLYHTYLTVREAWLGYLIGNGLAFVMAIFMAEFPILESSLYPYVIAFRSLPVVAVAPLLIIWLGFTVWPIVAAAALICFFPTLVNGVAGFKATDPTTLMLMRGLNASRWQIFRHVKLYNALPYIFSALKIGVASALVGAVVGEWISAEKGLGFLTILANNYVDTLLLFRAMIMIGVTGILWFMMIVKLEEYFIKWQETEAY